MYDLGRMEMTGVQCQQYSLASGGVSHVKFVRAYCTALGADAEQFGLDRIAVVFSVARAREYLVIGLHKSGARRISVDQDVP